MDMKIHVSPRMLCPCGKTVRTMTREEREAYDEALHRLAESAKTTEPGEPSRAAYDVAQRLFAGNGKTDGESPESSPCDDAREE